MVNIAALETYLLPFNEIFQEDGVSEISINRPKEAWIENRGDMRVVTIEKLDFNHLIGLARLVAQATDQKVNEQNPLLSSTLPNGYRIQIVLPPACESGNIVMSIRKGSTLNWGLDDYEKMGAFDTTSIGELEDKTLQELKDLVSQQKIKEFLQKAIIYKKNMIISGGTSTGKTTFTNACLRAIPSDERIITCEDAREIKLSDQPNKVHLLASKGDQGQAKVTMQDLIESCLRLRPDRIIVGELRGAEAFSFLRAINTGHPGSISTLHADTPRGAIEQLILMVMQAGLGMEREQLKDYILQVVDIIIQLKRGAGGKRYVSEIFFNDR